MSLLNLTCTDIMYPSDGVPDTRGFLVSIKWGWTAEYIVKSDSGGTFFSY